MCCVLMTEEPSQPGTWTSSSKGIPDRLHHLFSAAKEKNRHHAFETEARRTGGHVNAGLGNQLSQ